jgi:hypothetical protein
MRIMASYRGYEAGSDWNYIVGAGGTQRGFTDKRRLYLYARDGERDRDEDVCEALQAMSESRRVWNAFIGKGRRVINLGL